MLQTSNTLTIKATLTQKYKDNTFTIGADPELEISESYHLYNPIPQTKYNDSDDEDITPYGRISCDGSTFQLELRPNPSYSISELVNNIKELIQVIKTPVSVIGDRYPLGFHIHFGISIKNEDDIETIVKALDDFLGRRFIELSGKARGSYKKLGTYRLQPWGFEYRTLPSAIMLEPYILRIVLKLAYLLVKQLLNKSYLEYKVDLKGLPLDNEYLKFLKPKELAYMLYFIQNYNKLKKLNPTINKNWVEATNGILATQKFDFHIIFNDDWLRPEIKTYILNFFKKLSYRLNNDVKIIFYGLKQERGKVVSNYPSQKFEVIDHKISDTIYNFGFCWYLRNEAPIEEVKEELQTLWKYLEKELLQKKLLKNTNS